MAAAARLCQDVTVVINNAGIANVSKLLDGDGAASLQQHMDTNFLGMLRVSNQFAPALKKDGGGALVNVLSIVSFITAPMLSAYSVSKTAAWGLTNGLRNELRSQDTQVLALHVGFMDTDLTRAFDIPKTSPDVVAARTYGALEAGASEVMADEGTNRLKLIYQQKQLPT